MKGVGMLVVSLKGINLRFWSHLGCSGQNAIIFSREGLVQGLNSKFPTSIPTFHMRYAECPPPRAFGWASVSYDWSMVFKVTVNQSQATLATQTIPEIIAPKACTCSLNSF